MRKLRIILALVLAAPALAPLGAAAGVQDFTIPQFEADYYLSRDTDHISHLRVHEHIVANFPDFDQNHGILRAIPDRYQGHTVDLRVQSVTNDSGQALHYSRSNSNSNLVLRIGDASRYVHGRQVYNIDYTQDNVTVNNSGYDGHFWDVNGDQWQQQFGQVTARVHLTNDLAAAGQPDGSRCFTGQPGSTTQACTAAIEPETGGSALATFTATRPLETGETLTYELRFAPGTFAAYHLTTAQIWGMAAIAAALALPTIITLIVAVIYWRRYGRDPSGRGVIIPEYVPPKEVSVLGAGVTLREKLEPKAITAQIIDLAVRGYIKIYETKRRVILADVTSYELELTRDPADLRNDEQAVINLVFGAFNEPGSRIKLDSLKNKLYVGAASLNKSQALALTAGGYFRTDPTTAAIPFLLIGLAALAAGFLLYQITLGVFVPQAGFAFLPPAVILFISAKFMPARTAKGVGLHDYLLGLRDYMRLAEADRIKVMQSPHGSLTEKIDTADKGQLVKLYERLLPYAMLFGIEKDWAKEFAQLYQQPPGWYSGTSSFNAGYFAGSLAGFSQASSASFTPPSSSGAGGSAGGGGGGGGGGGW